MKSCDFLKAVFVFFIQREVLKCFAKDFFEKFHNLIERWGVCFIMYKLTQ